MRVRPCSSSSPRSTPQARGARVYAEVAGAGITADSHDIAQPDPAGRGATRAMQIALREAGLDAADIVHVNAHATSTPQGDVAEAGAIRARARRRRRRRRGHRDQVDDRPPARCRRRPRVGRDRAGAARTASCRRRSTSTTPRTSALDIADQAARAAGDGDLAALNNSFGFGGHNVAIAFKNV